MAWGYERGFVIEYAEIPKKRIDCKACCYYDKSDCILWQYRYIY